MIEIFEGRLGGGKTYSAVVRIVDHVRRGGLVCTNVEIIWDAIKAYCAKHFEVVVEDDQILKLTDDQMANFHRHTPSGTPEMNVLVVVDEAHLSFNSRDWAQSSRELLAFLTQSRKVHTDIIFISQSAENIDKQFRRLVQFIWRFRDLSRWKIPGLGLAYPFQHILMCQFDYDGTTMLQKTFITKARAVFGLYNTNSLLRTFPRLEGVVTSRKLKKSGKDKTNHMKTIIILMAVVAAICAYLFYTKYQEMAHPKPPELKSTPAPTNVSQSANLDALNAIRRSQDTPKEKEKKLTAYDIYDEEFMSWNGYDKILKTNNGWYQIGEMSNKGFVRAISEDRARIDQPDGRTGWVVARPVSAQGRIVVRNGDITHAEVIPPPPTPHPEKKHDVFGERLDKGTLYPPDPSLHTTPSPTTPTPAMGMYRGARGMPIQFQANKLVPLP